MAVRDEITVHELSFDENGFMAKLSHEVEISSIPEVFRSRGSEEILNKYLIDSQLFAKRFREVSSRSMLNPRRIGAEEVSPKQFQLKAEQIMNRHRTMDDSVIVREAMSEILTTDLEMGQLRQFMERMASEDVRIVHRRVKIPSPLGLTLFMSSFEDLLSLRTRAYLIKDVDPEILRRLLGARSLATELDREKALPVLSVKGLSSKECQRTPQTNGYGWRPGEATHSPVVQRQTKGHRIRNSQDLGPRARREGPDN